MLLYKSSYTSDTLNKRILEIVFSAVFQMKVVFQDFWNLLQCPYIITQSKLESLLQFSRTCDCEILVKATQNCSKCIPLCSKWWKNLE